MSIVDVSPGTVLELESRPEGSVTVHGNGNIIRIGRNVRLRADIWLRGHNSTVEIDHDCDIDGVIHVLRGGATIRIGRGVSAVGVGIVLHEPGEVTIGDGCMFSGDIHMDVSDVHPIYDRTTGVRLNPPRPIRIGERVWVGTRVLIAKGARIGDGAVIGAGATVVGAIPADCIAVGTPAKVLRGNIVWRRDLDDPAGPLVAAKRGWLAGLTRRLPEGLNLHARSPLPQKAPLRGGREPEYIAVLNATPDEPGPGISIGLPQREGPPGYYVDAIGKAMAPLKQDGPLRTPAGAPIVIHGFAFDRVARTPAGAVDVVIDGKAYAADYGGARLDVAQAYGEPALAACGFVLTLQAGLLKPGPHSLVLRVVTADGAGWHESRTFDFEAI